MSKKTALFEEHVRLGGRMIDFGGWDLPVQYTGLIDEHQACRTAAGLFDVSHMGEFHCEGKDAESFLNYAVTNDVSKIEIGQAQYTVMCYSNGGIVDDLIIYRRTKDQYLIVVNASNIEKDFSHLKSLATENEAKFPSFTLVNESSNYSQIAIQGPKAEMILSKITNSDLSKVATYRFIEGKVLQSTPAIIARTGYTGEDGFEIYVETDAGPKIWRALLDAGQPFGIKPCGLGARDTLRLEMKYPLYGHELSAETNPIEAGLGWVTKLEKPNFHGKDAIQKIKESGVARKLVGIKLLGRGIPRQGYLAFDFSGKTEIGVITSGTQSPSLREPIGIAYLQKGQSEIGSKFQVKIREQMVEAEVVKTPFYKRPY